MTAHAEILYTPADVYAATGISVPKQNQWYDRRTVKPSRLDKKPTGSGCYRMVSAATVHQFAVTATCTQLGIPAKQAAEAARLLSLDQPNREANELFQFGRTLLVIKPTGTDIINADYSASLTDVLGRPLEHAIVIDIGNIVQTVNEKLKSFQKAQRDTE